MHRELASRVRAYLARQARLHELTEALPAPAAGLKLCVVIPSLAEAESLPAVLSSLTANRRLPEAEVLVLVNQSDRASAVICRNNQDTLNLQQQYAEYPVPVHFLDRASPGRAFPFEQAGVGLARRWGMDAGLARLAQAGNLEQGALACLDADSPVAPGYVDHVLEIFASARPPLAGFCAYAHPEPGDPVLRQAGVAYELWLRYVVAGLQAAGSWFAFPTIGSCTVVSAAAYVQVGGMEPRQAAEDFHFLRKVAKLGGERPLAHLAQARVFPAARVSDRVLFGTGRAMQRSLAEGADVYLWVEPPEAFLDLAVFFKLLPEAFADLNCLRDLPPRLQAFLEAEGAQPVLEKFRDIYPGPRQFTRACQHWFDNLRCIRYANEVTREQGRTWAFAAWRKLLEKLGSMDNMADLPVPEPGQGNAELYVQWLERVRGLAV
jgi:GT2 family glycosyltransferase